MLTFRNGGPSHAASRRIVGGRRLFPLSAQGSDHDELVGAGHLHVPDLLDGNVLEAPLLGFLVGIEQELDENAQGAALDGEHLGLVGLRVDPIARERGNVARRIYDSDHLSDQGFEKLGKGGFTVRSASRNRVVRLQCCRAVRHFSTPFSSK